MSSEHVAVSLVELSKRYQIYDSPSDRLKQFVFPIFRRILRLPSKNYFKEFWALRDISFAIKVGETVGIIGRNGSGKSTLLQIICGTLNPSSGDVQIHGRVAALLELGAGFNPEFSGKENVYLNAALHGLSKAEVDSRFEAILSFAEIGDFIDLPVKTYSSGMYVRLAFAVIAHVDADILVIDEALAVGDIFFTQKCMRFLKKFQERGTVLFVTHDTSALLALCDRAVWIEEGKVQEEGEAKTVCEKYLARKYNSVRSSFSLEKEQGKQPLERGEFELCPAPELDDGVSALGSVMRAGDVQIFKFKAANYGFGNGGAQISLVELNNKQGLSLQWINGGEFVKINIHVKILIDVRSLIIGFFVKDRLGQVLFGENTNTAYELKPVAAAKGSTVIGSFAFFMPFLSRGSYSIDVAVADGDLHNHEQLHWLHDAIVFESHRTSISAGLVGIPFEEISVTQ
jgi:lipopolysaccharide transport system ATP-binding protein